MSKRDIYPRGVASVRVFFDNTDDAAASIDGCFDVPSINCCDNYLYRTECPAALVSPIFRCGIDCMIVFLVVSIAVSIVVQDTGSQGCCRKV